MAQPSRATMSSGIAEHAARFSSLHAETLLLVQERQRARGLNLPTVAVEPTEALIANHVAVLADTLQEMASAVRVTDAAARSGRVALSEVRQAEDDLTEAKTSLESLLVMLGTDLWASELRAHTKSSCVLMDPPFGRPEALCWVKLLGRIANGDLPFCSVQMRRSESTSTRHCRAASGEQGVIVPSESGIDRAARILPRRCGRRHRG